MDNRPGEEDRGSNPCDAISEDLFACWATREVRSFCCGVWLYVASCNSERRGLEGIHCPVLGFGISLYHLFLCFAQRTLLVEDTLALYCNGNTSSTKLPGHFGGWSTAFGWWPATGYRILARCEEDLCSNLSDANRLFGAAAIDQSECFFAGIEDYVRVG